MLVEFRCVFRLPALPSIDGASQIHAFDRGAHGVEIFAGVQEDGAEDRLDGCRHGLLADRLPGLAWVDKDV